MGVCCCRLLSVGQVRSGESEDGEKGGGEGGWGGGLRCFPVYVSCPRSVSMVEGRGSVDGGWEGDGR